MGDKTKRMLCDRGRDRRNNPRRITDKSTIENSHRKLYKEVLLINKNVIEPLNPLFLIARVSGSVT